jgi:hypothetical protein
MPKGKEDSRLVGAGAGGVQPAPPAGGDTLDDLMAIPVGVGPTPTTVREAEEFDIRDAIVRAKVRAFRSHIGLHHPDLPLSLHNVMFCDLCGFWSWLAATPRAPEGTASTLLDPPAVPDPDLTNPRLGCVIRLFVHLLFGRRRPWPMGISCRRR